MNSDGRRQTGFGLSFQERQRNQARARAAWLGSLRQGSPGRRHGGRK